MSPYYSHGHKSQYLWILFTYKTIFSSYDKMYRVKRINTYKTHGQKEKEKES